MLRRREEGSSGWGSRVNGKHQHLMPGRGIREGESAMRWVRGEERCFWGEERKRKGIRDGMKVKGKKDQDLPLGRRIKEEEDSPRCLER